MKAFEFSTRMENGVIEVPSFCRDSINEGENVRVIVLLDGGRHSSFRPGKRPFKRRFEGDRDDSFRRDRRPFKKRFGDDFRSDRRPFKKRFDKNHEHFRSEEKPFKKRFEFDKDVLDLQNLE